MPDVQSEIEEFLGDFDDASDSDSINYREALAKQKKEIISLKD